MYRFCSFVVGLLLCAAVLVAQPKGWEKLSSWDGQLPNPDGSNEQTGALVAKLIPNSPDCLVISYRVKAPALVMICKAAQGWQREVIEPDCLRLEAGGAAYDIDGDGDLDIVFGEDAGGDKLYWWENPHPNTGRWTRRVIKQSGARQHHDQVFADILGTGKAQLYFWNQKAKTLFMAEIPKQPRDANEWLLRVVYAGQAGEQTASAAAYAEGVDAFDIDGDGKLDLLAGNHWFKYLGDGKFQPVRIGEIGGRIRAGHFKRGKVPQVVIAPGDGSGPLMIYECAGNPLQSECWKGRKLLPRDMVHGHTLEVGDINGDGRLDIFAAEMAKWTNKPIDADHPDATSWILYGDGKGGFKTTVFTTGVGWHEGKLADIDGDGDLDIVGKPYTWRAPGVAVWLNPLKRSNPSR